MKKFAILFCISLLTYSCSKSDDGDGNTDADFIVHRNSTLSIIENNNAANVMVENGENLVFEYRFSTEGEPQIADDEYTEIVYFELDANTEDFNLNSNDFEAANAYVGRFCFCGNTGFFPISNGEIIGEKVGSRDWKVSLAVEAIIEAQENSPEMSIEAEASGIFRTRN
ncbi:hypothetical protein [Christiangramia sp. SM2212]|uniref:Lipoprotein n=1 Tax=Christiangramia sediminicola TaxID=3073267 RepID=A0ABU1EU48_9FLAO|nr:hypothetical protein [Christiangramia sp. SM2212]MDR5591542.1 hypothetical protein [Christiangramia sp. SM2212]